MRQATLNSLIRSLLNVTQVPRALRMLSIMLNMGLKPYRSTVMALIAGCARDSSSVEAAKFYWWVTYTVLCCCRIVIVQLLILILAQVKAVCCCSCTTPLTVMLHGLILAWKDWAILN